MTALLEVYDLKKHFPVERRRFFGKPDTVKAVDGVSFALMPGQTLGLVGESGCGKSTLGRAILQLTQPSSGRIYFEGHELTGLSALAMKPWRRHMQMIFQDPYGSLNPRRTVLETIREPLDAHRLGSRAERRARVDELLELVGLSSRMAARYPHEFSGGQRQRIGIARALALNPRFIVADEPVSALDVSVQAQVLNLIAAVQERFGIALLFIAHDLAVVQHVSHQVGVMYLGRLVEKASAEAIYAAPCHPYTQALLSAVPAVRRQTPAKRLPLQGELPSPLAPPAGCPFHPRCPEVRPICRLEDPPEVRLVESHGEHLVKCHLYSGA